MKRISRPQITIATPLIETANPFTVHLGLLYINEDRGPIIELLCPTNIIPAITSTNPATSNSLTKMGFLIIMKLIIHHC